MTDRFKLRKERNQASMFSKLRPAHQPPLSNPRQATVVRKSGLAQTDLTLLYPGQLL